ncbi:hypothetical protein BDQ17DRAFT_1333217 [Cyathus striatus]|nr:hypothetical protein BDQ17DRAFT_1333217 [Cyathus striatus]
MAKSPVFIAQLPAEETESTSYYSSIDILKNVTPLRPKSSYEFRCNITLQDIEEESTMSTNASVTDLAHEQRGEDVKVDNLCCRGVHSMFFWHNVSLVSRKLRRLKERVRKTTQPTKITAPSFQM